jgi:hypothetical protein
VVFMKPHQTRRRRSSLILISPTIRCTGTRKVGSSEATTIATTIAAPCVLRPHPLSQAEAGEYRRCRQQIRSCCRHTRIGGEPNAATLLPVGSATHSAVDRMLF